jgi:hypothetical protein
MSSLGERLMPRWRAIIAGAVVAAGVSFTLHAFAAGIGLSVMSSAPTWRDSTPMLWVISGIYLLFAALCAFSVGGYIAGRLGAPIGADAAETEALDGLQGLATWGLAILIAAVLALGVAIAAAPAVSPSGSTGATQSVAGENIIASELDELFRSPHAVPDLTYRRAEAARILLKASSHSGIGSEDRDYLGTLTANLTGIDRAGAQDRVERVIAASRVELHKARMAALLQAFSVAAALFVGAAVAWASAVHGGRDRDARLLPVWRWGREEPISRRTVSV